MRILITGASGFIGKNLLTYLEGLYNTVVGTDFENDVRFLKAVNIGIKPDVVIHCAAQTSVVKSMKEPLIDATTNIMGTINLLQAFPKSKFIYLSTSAVYGEGVEHKEDGKTNPMSAYAVSKLAGEQYVKLFAKNYIILRLANVVGDYEKANPNVFDIFKKSKVLTVYGDGSQRRDFIGVAEVCNAIERSINSQSIGIFNIGSGKTRSIIDVAKSFGKKIIFKSRREGEIHILSMDISKARNACLLVKK